MPLASVLLPSRNVRRSGSGCRRSEPLQTSAPPVCLAPYQDARLGRSGDVEGTADAILSKERIQRRRTRLVSVVTAEGGMVAGSVTARYLVAAFAFMAAAAWDGVSLTGGFTCLFVFVLALQAVRLSQRRGETHSRRPSSRRQRPSRQESDRAEVASPAPPPRHDRSRPSGRVYDGDREEIGWPVASEATW
jgi:hypothetical protein